MAWRTPPIIDGLRPAVLVLLALWTMLLGVLGMTELIHLDISDKAQHFVGFGALSVLVFFSFKANVPRKRVFVATLGIVGIACVLSEVAQGVLTAREFDVHDILANLLGSSTFLFVAWMVDRWIIQPGQIVSFRNSARYWAFSTEGLPRSFETGNESEADVDVELDEILMSTPPLAPQEQR